MAYGHLCQKEASCYFYGLHITTILKAININLSGKKETRNVIATNIYNSKTMKQMHHILQDNTWVKVGGVVEEEEDEEAQLDGDGV